MTSYATLYMNFSEIFRLNRPRSWRSRTFVSSAILVSSLLFLQGFSGLVRGQQEPLSAVAASWEGIPTDFTLEPPDPDGSAGPNGGLQGLNVRSEDWTKAGTQI